MSESAGVPPQPKFVGKGSNAGAINPKDPQWWLAGSLHPYAPFVGNALKWESYVYDDGTTYEGLMLVDVPHNKGVLVFGNGLGGGRQRAARGDRYEGEFDSGFVHGLGQYTHAKDGKVYRGEFLAGFKHGCGVEYDVSPFLRRVERGMDPDAAWQEAQAEIDSRATYGTWLRDVYAREPDPSGRWCHMREIQGTLQEVDSVVAKARMFEYKPDGEVTIRMQQDAYGFPAPLMQDPLHYPHGTKFLAPGPMGQVFPVPDEEALRLKMAQAADQHRKIYDSYNLPYDVEPGSVMEKAQRIWKRKQSRKQRQLEKRQQREQQRIRRLERETRRGEEEEEDDADERKGGGRGQGPPPPAAPSTPSAPSRGQGKPSRPAGPTKGAAPPAAAPGVDDDDIDEDDLIAYVADPQQPQQAAAGSAAGGNPPGTPARPPSTFASVSLGLSRAAVAMQRAFHQAAVRAPPRRSLTRPSSAAGRQ